MKKNKTGPKPETGETRNNCITIKFTDTELAEIEEIAKNIDIPRTTLLRNMALSGLKDAKFLNNFGILKGTKRLIDFEAKLRNPKKYPQLEI
jgi:hypothetical protein